MKQHFYSTPEIKVILVLEDTIRTSGVEQIKETDNFGEYDWY